MTPDIKALVSTATELYGKIARAHDNLLKLGVTKITLGAVEARLYMLKKYWSKFDGLNDELADHHARLANDDYLKQNIPALAEESYLVNKGLLLDLKCEFQAKKSTASVCPSTTTSSASRTTLPRIQLPIFDKYEDWPAF